MNKQFSLVFVSTKVLPDKKLDKDCAALKVCNKYFSLGFNVFRIK